VNAPPILQRHPSLRWLAPVGIACVAGMAATGFFRGSTSSSTASLPATTPAALIAAVQEQEVEGFSGTVVTHVSLGLPQVPALAGSTGSTSFTGLLSGAHTLQVWYGGASRQRIALLGATDETDVFRDGRQVWQWSSANRTAVHAMLPPGTDVPPSLEDLTPLGLARRLLTGLEPSTRVAVDRSHEVADRSAYDLVLTPRDAATRIGEVRIAVDGRTKSPLGVQVTARGASAPAVDIAFTKIAFGRQPARTFRFTPPDDARVRQLPPSHDAGRSTAMSTRAAARTTGSGWSSVVETRPGAKALTSLRHDGALAAFTSVSGTWGTGYLLDGDLFSALVTTDGRVLVGAVAPPALYAAAGQK